MPEYPIRPGLALSWDSTRPGSAPPAAAPDTSASFHFVISGDSTRGDDRMTLSSGHSPAALSVVVTASAFHVALHLSATALQELLLDDRSPGATQLRAFSAGAPAITLPLTPGARLAVESIRRCPFAGACRAMALTARAHDLLLEFLTALSAAGSSASLSPPLTRAADGQVRAAAAFLDRHLEEPPTLAALSREVGLSETSLKRGFHQVFDSTVFGYLRARRMERAHALLQSGEATVLEAAALVGYSNPSNFAAAFRRQFGINPKEFQLTVRR